MCDAYTNLVHANPYRLYFSQISQGALASNPLPLKSLPGFLSDAESNETLLQALSGSLPAKEFYKLFFLEKYIRDNLSRL